MHNRRFQSTPPRRWWHVFAIGNPFLRYFNPHHHAGGDLTILLNHMPLLYFNPHHHAGGDSKEVYYSRVYTISIHTTTQVVTIRNSQMAEDIKISIHTTTQVVTIFSRSVNERWIISIHTTTQVVTGWMRMQRVKKPISIHTTTQVVTI